MSDGSRAKEGSVDLLEVPLGLMTRARAKRFKEASRAKEGSVDLLEVPLGPMTRARAKRFKEALHVLI